MARLQAVSSGSAAITSRASPPARRRWISSAFPPATIRCSRAGWTERISATSGAGIAMRPGAPSRRQNPHSDEYGGSLENRLRLVREILEETREAIGPDRALALRFTAARHNAGGAEPGEYAEMVERLKDLPDLWDVVPGDYMLEMGSSRFVKEGALEPFIAYVRKVTGKPVVSVGRFTSPDAMVAQLRRGVV